MSDGLGRTLFYDPSHSLSVVWGFPANLLHFLSSQPAMVNPSLILGHVATCCTAKRDGCQVSLTFGVCYVLTNVSAHVPGACWVAWPSTGPGHNVNISVKFAFVFVLDMEHQLYCSLAPVHTEQLLCRLVAFMVANCTLFFLHVVPCFCNQF